jgi:hypothetical protein
MISGLIEKARRFLTNRKAAYCRVFNQEENDARVVLADLAQFCRAHSSTYHPDVTQAGRLDGRREVWLRIEQHLQLTPDELYALYGGRQLKGD